MFYVEHSKKSFRNGRFFLFNQKTIPIFVMLKNHTMPHEFILPKIYQTNAFPFNRGYKTTKVIPKKYGFILHRFSNYVSLQNVKIVYNENGFSKATVKVNTNYKPPYQYTIYFDNEGNEIKVNNNTLMERKKWLEMQK